MDAVAKDVERFCIFEDDLPRSGGRWPEYAATMILCFDRWENDMAIGSLWTFFQSTPIPFHGLDNLLFIMDAMMDQAEAACGLFFNLPRFHFTGWITCFLSWMP